jgi:hypothetical protein
MNFLIFEKLFGVAFSIVVMWGVLLLLFVVSCSGVARSCQRCSSLQQGPYFFTQKVDHFSSSSATFQQKYYLIPGAAHGPVFLYISGEAPLSGFETDEVSKKKEKTVPIKSSFSGHSLC